VVKCIIKLMDTSVQKSVVDDTCLELKYRDRGD
jgi:hypothetical protein